MDGTCRLCAKVKPAENLKTAIDDSALNITQKLIVCCRWNSFDYQESLPTSICCLCFDELERSWAFAQAVEQAQIELRASSVKKEPSDNENAVGIVVVGNDFSADCRYDVKNDSSDDDDACLLDEDLGLAECFVQEYASDEKANEISNATNAKKDFEKDKKRHDEETRTDMEATNTANKKSNYKNDEEFLKNFSKDDCNPDATLTDSAVKRLNLKSWSQLDYKCKECDVITLGLDEFRSHFETTHPNKTIKYICFDCPKVFRECSFMIRHALKFHKARGTALRHCCLVCSKFLWSLKRKRVHQETHNVYKCDECSKIFSLKSSLTTHKRTHLPMEQRRIFQCDYCQKCLTRKADLISHIMSHMGSLNEKKHTCWQCGSSFTQKQSLKIHMDGVHATERPCVCDTCGKTFKTRVNLRKHSKIHSNIRNYKCPECNKAFRDKYHLDEHKRIHTGEKPFICEFCSKSFRHPNSFREHINTHTGVRPNICVVDCCERSFTSVSNLNKHIKRVHKINKQELLMKNSSKKELPAENSEC